jgi:hypothetical protein
MAKTKAKAVVIGEPTPNVEIEVQVVSKEKTLRVVAARDTFVDLISNSIIGQEPVDVVPSTWLQAQIDRGLLRVV